MALRINHSYAVGAWYVVFLSEEYVFHIFAFVKIFSYLAFEYAVASSVDYQYGRGAVGEDSFLYNCDSLLGVFPVKVYFNVIK